MGQPSTGNPSAYSIPTGARFVNRVPVVFFAGLGQKTTRPKGKALRRTIPYDIMTALYGRALPVTDGWPPYHTRG